MATWDLQNLLSSFIYFSSHCWVSVFTKANLLSICYTTAIPRVLQQLTVFQSLSMHEIKLPSLTQDKALKSGNWSKWMKTKPSSFRLIVHRRHTVNTSVSLVEIFGAIFCPISSSGDRCSSHTEGSGLEGSQVCFIPWSDAIMMT